MVVRRLEILRQFCHALSSPAGFRARSHKASLQKVKQTRNTCILALHGPHQITLHNCHAESKILLHRYRRQRAPAGGAICASFSSGPFHGAFALKSLFRIPTTVHGPSRATAKLGALHLLVAFYVALVHCSDSRWAMLGKAPTETARIRAEAKIYGLT